MFFEPILYRHMERCARVPGAENQPPSFFHSIISEMMVPSIDAIRRDEAVLRSTGNFRRKGGPKKATDSSVITAI